MGNIIAIVGRPMSVNQPFNRLTSPRDTIVKEVSGVTRDRIYSKENGMGLFSIIDTGGYAHGTEDVFEAEIRKQVDLAIEEANAIIFMVDVMAELLILMK